MAPWKTRRVAADTRSLPLEGARWVDEQLAARVDGFGLPTIERLVALAAARFAPEEQAEKEQAAGPGTTSRSPTRGRVSSPAPPGSRPPATPQDLTAFYALVCEEAKQLGRLGDTDDYETRKAKALGIIAGRQGSLELDATEAPGRHAAAPPRKPVQTHLYVHVSLADLATHLAGAPAVGEVEKLGPATLDLIRSWLHDSKASIQPVLDLNRTDAVDQHDPPPWMREQVILRDRHCVFPWCGRDARLTDLDHIIPYVPPDEGGPPGQTNPRTWRRCAGDITAPRPSPAGPTNAPATAPTVDQPPRAHLDRRTRRNDGTRLRPRPHPPARTEPRRTPSPPDADPVGGPQSATTRIDGATDGRYSMRPWTSQPSSAIRRRVVIRRKPTGWSARKLASLSQKPSLCCSTERK